MRPAVFDALKASLEAQGWSVVPKCEHTSPEVAAIAARGVNAPESLSPAEIKSVCASALTQAPEKTDPAG